MLHSVPGHTAMEISFLQSWFFKWFLTPPSPVHSVEALPCLGASAKQPALLRNERLGARWLRGTCHPPTSAHTLCEDGTGLTFQVLHDAPQTVPVGCDEHPLAGLDLGGDLVIPEGQGPGDGVLEALSRGQLPRLQACVATLLGASMLRFTPQPGPPSPDPPPPPDPQPLTLLMQL